MLSFPSPFGVASLTEKLPEVSVCPLLGVSTAQALGKAYVSLVQRGMSLVMPLGLDRNANFYRLAPLAFFHKCSFVRSPLMIASSLPCQTHGCFFKTRNETKNFFLSFSGKQE
jgi:hypothetical protein